MKKVYLGIDLGGTNVRVAKVDEAGAILELVSASSLASESTDVILENIMTQIQKISDLTDVCGIGIGVPGPVNQEKGWMNLATNIPNLKEVPIRDYLMEKTGLPVYLDNDATCTGLAEALLGGGKGYSHVVYITHSTGIGAGIVIDGKPISGAHGFGGEIANISVDPYRQKINHLNAGAVEAWASGVAIVSQSQEKIDSSISSGKHFFDLVKQNHSTALEILDQITSDFARMMSTITAVIDPDIYVIGGGVSLSADLYLPIVKEKYQKLVHEYIKDIPIVTAQIEHPGIIGAALLVKAKGE